MIVNREKIIATTQQVINHFPCNKPHLLQMINYLRTVDSHTVFELKKFQSEDDEKSVVELVLKGLETGLDIEEYFPLNNTSSRKFNNTHSCSVFFNEQAEIERIVFTLTSNSREASFDIEFGADFEFKWYQMYYLQPERMLGHCNDCVNSLVDEMSYLAC